MLANKPKLLTVGEFLWDNFPDGRRLGGAPGNVACIAAALGADAHLISAVGDDPDGHEALAILIEKGVNTGLVSILPGVPTGTVTVEMDKEKGHTFTIDFPAAWDHIAVTKETETHLKQADALVFGTLGQRTEAAKAATAEIINLTPPDCIRLCDANFRPPYDDHNLLDGLLKRSTAVKINDEELVAYAPGQSPESFFQTHGHLNLLIYTRGPHGAKVLRRTNTGIEEVDHPGLEVDVVDTVGAGDSFTATLLVSLLNREPLQTSVEKAINIAAHVCTKQGATPPLPT